MKIVKKILKIILGILLIPILYVVLTIAHGTATDFQPEEVIALEIEQPNKLTTIQDSTLSFVIWNVGYGGLGEESDFFYDSGGFLTSKGKTVRTTQENVEKNIDGALSFLGSHPNVDFFMLQEVDFGSRRSYKINQFEKYEEKLSQYSSTFAVNYRAPRVPLPVFEPWNVMGKMESGLGTFSKYTPSKATRYQLPGEYPWPDRIFHLDRCAAFHRYPMADEKELILVNIHNSAYDSGGTLKKAQMDYLKSKFQTEYEQGNYLVIGGDWNQRPDGIVPASFGGKELENPEGMIIPKDYFADWNWAYDPVTPTNRALKDPYKKGESRINLIDFFLISPNLKVDKVEGINMDFKYSDHQPVLVEVSLIPPVVIEDIEEEKPQ
ncbi:MAG: endonuclease/exonuclease/phosphatase family metal-dependent hydrolase [Maribacter sp.]|jgi:endonuclease/exonuclease/phosphatase family metal-dependent hydrolase